ncbi:oligopeptide ABC transporter permease [Staphylococcus simulans]|uniref:oligopeptide ABC transporter permease n=1 Tax=Staphylococcus simulans TaxID=1286 RepID=UPI000CD2CE46|nr:peptide ABC transporter permease [Staphylococcus simulans]PTJ25157.1 ABC transporter permease [Staphylococcus simulans]SQE74772.1 Oligopeptide transport system permease protein oppC [Staphylococcus simulans]
MTQLSSESKSSNELKRVDLSKFRFRTIDVNDIEKNEREYHSTAKHVWLQIRKNKAAFYGMIGLIILVLFALIGPLVSSYTYYEQDTNSANLPPKIQGLDKVSFLPFDGKDASGRDLYAEQHVEKYHWFGTDNLGRDIWTRTWKGTQISIFIGLVAAFMDVTIGVTYGAISGYLGGKTDLFLQRLIEILSSIPNLIVLILFVLIFEPSIWTIILAMSVTGWIGMSRITRGQFMKLKNEEFVLAARSLGVSNLKIIFKHILPNATGAIIVTSMFTVPSAIFFEAFLSFIGLGIPAPQASLGSLVNTGRKFLLTFPYQLFIPAIVLSLLILCFYLFSDGIRDAFDPKSE